MEPVCQLVLVDQQEQVLDVELALDEQLDKDVVRDKDLVLELVQHGVHHMGMEHMEHIILLKDQDHVLEKQIMKLKLQVRMVLFLK